MLLDHWLKGSEKSFSKLDNHVHNRKAASSITLLASKESLENIILFLFCQILQVTASHLDLILISCMRLNKKEVNFKLERSLIKHFFFP